MGTTDTKLLFSGCQEHITGSNLEFQLPSHLGNHSIAWGCNWRQLYGFNPNVPMSIREHAGHSLKSSIKVHFTGTLLRVGFKKTTPSLTLSSLLGPPFFSPLPPSTLLSSLPSSLLPTTQHTMESDERDNPFLPRSGYRVRSTQELAGLGGDVFFGKAEMQTELYKEIVDNWVSGLQGSPLDSLW